MLPTFDNPGFTASEQTGATTRWLSLPPVTTPKLKGEQPNKPTSEGDIQVYFRVVPLRKAAPTVLHTCVSQDQEQGPSKPSS